MTLFNRIITHAERQTLHQAFASHAYCSSPNWHHIEIDGISIEGTSQFLAMVAATPPTSPDASTRLLRMEKAPNTEEHERNRET